MSEKLSAEAISRRKALSMLGLAGALGLASATRRPLRPPQLMAGPAPQG
jgi:hypothetical protein